MKRREARRLGEALTGKICDLVEAALRDIDWKDPVAASATVRAIVIALSANLGVVANFSNGFAPDSRVAMDALIRDAIEKVLAAPAQERISREGNPADRISREGSAT